MSENVDIEKDLRRTVSDVAARFEKNPHRVLEEALDLTLETTPDGQLVGFSMLIGYGGPNIEVVYHRGSAAVYGAWASVEVKYPVSRAAAEKILDELDELPRCGGRA
ncbi:MAG: hypothetical protein ACP5RJ_08725 [Conexivisphaera sp.]|jgi:hypothetical protein